MFSLLFMKSDLDVINLSCLQGCTVCGRQSGGQAGPAAAVAAVQGQVGLDGRRASIAGMVRSRLNLQLMQPGCRRPVTIGSVPGMRSRRCMSLHSRRAGCQTDVL